MPPGQVPSGEPRRFPLLDDEPPPRPWWQRLLVPLAVIVVAGAVGAAVTLWPTSSPGSRPAAGDARRLVGLPGVIVSVAPDQYLVVSGPDGSRPVEVKALGNVGDAVYPSLDDRYMSLGNGQIVATSPTRVPALASTRVGLFPGDQNSGFIEPFADHDRELVVLLSPSFSTATDFVVSEVSLATGRSVPLGIAHQVAGDPQGRGVFVSVAGPVAPTTSVTDVSPDSRLELREAGLPTRVLATAAAINRALGQDPRRPVALTPYPNPAGTQIAVTVQAQSGGSTSGVVILNRRGRVLGTVATPNGPAGSDAVSWSPSGLSVAFTSIGPGGPDLRIWSPGQLRTEAFPAGSKDNFCLWSPDGQTLLCSSGQDNGRRWLFASPSGGAMTAVTGPGLPVAWLGR
jgi:hypothetical protein